MTNKPDPREFILALPLDELISVSDLKEACGVDDLTAKRALAAAFSSDLLKPMQRKVASGEEWKFHLLAIARLRDEPSVFEIAFKRI